MEEKMKENLFRIYAYIIQIYDELIESGFLKMEFIDDCSIKLTDPEGNSELYEYKNDIVSITKTLVNGQITRTSTNSKDPDKELTEVFRESKEKEDNENSNL